MTHEIEIKFNSTGIKTIPSIKKDSIITIHGRNGVGKSMAATMLEIATGVYIFPDAEKFRKIKSKLSTCKITIKINDFDIIKINLFPSYWRFDEKTNRINPLTIGKFEYNQKQIEYADLKKIIFTRVIRGDESLSEQIKFFLEIFYSKIEGKIKQIEHVKKILNTYKQYFFNIIPENIIKRNNELISKRDDLLNRIDNLEEKQKLLEEELSHIKERIKVMPELIFVLKNTEEDTKKKIKEREEKIQECSKEHRKYILELEETKKILEETTKSYNKKEKSILAQINKCEKNIFNSITSLNQIDPTLYKIKKKGEKISIDVKELESIKNDLKQKQKKIKFDIENLTKKIRNI
ncbi:MAG: hypothetical protein ACTSRZ_07020 [Promethearchaeota archaeon]